MRIVISLLLIIPIQILLLPCKAQDSNTTTQPPYQHIKIRYNATFEKIFSDYNKEKVDGRPEGGLSDDDTDNEPEGRPNGGLSDSILDGNGTQNTDYARRASKGLSDSILDDTGDNGNETSSTDENSGRPSGGLSDSILEGD